MLMIKEKNILFKMQMIMELLINKKEIMYNKYNS